MRQTTFEVSIRLGSRQKHIKKENTNIPDVDARVILLEVVIHYTVGVSPGP